MEGHKVKGELVKKGVEGGGWKCKEKWRNIIDRGWWKRRIKKEWLLKATQVKPGFMHNNSNSFITKISVPNILSNQPILPFFFDLKNLARHDLSYNDIITGFPTCFYHCSNLQHVDLSLNYLGRVSANADKWASWLTYVNVILYCNSYMYSVYLLGI